jgi:hypothetical protein
MIFGDEVGDDSLAVADRLAIVSDVGELPARSYGTPASLRKAAAAASKMCSWMK